MTINELPTEPGGYLWTDADGRNHLVSMHTNGYASGILLGQNATDWGTAWCNRASELPAGQWIRIPDADELIELTEKAAKWDAMQTVPPGDMAGCPVDHATPRRRGMRELLETDDHDPGEFEAARRKSENYRKQELARLLAPTGDDVDPAAETQAAGAVDPVVAAYREAIPVEGVPSWAEWVAVDADSMIVFYSDAPQVKDGEAEWLFAYGADGWAEFSGRWCVDLADNWRSSLRRVSDVWPNGGGE